MAPTSQCRQEQGKLLTLYALRQRTSAIDEALPTGRLRDGRRQPASSLLRHERAVRVATMI